MNKLLQEDIIRQCKNKKSDSDTDTQQHWKSENHTD